MAIVFNLIGIAILGALVWLAVRGGCGGRSSED